jgi:hypothetical protein
MYLGHLMFTIHLAKYAELCITAANTNLQGPLNRRPSLHSHPKQNKWRNNTSTVDETISFMHLTDSDFGFNIR